MNDRVTLFASWDRATQRQCAEWLRQHQREVRKMLTRSQVNEIINLYLVEKLGAKRISTLTGVSLCSVKRILAGKAYKEWTGGRVSNGRRPEAIYRGGNKSYLETILEEC
jgi:hypothetical protein